MSEENVELAYRSFDLFNRRDLEGFLALADEDVIAEPRMAAVEGRYHGHDGIRRWWQSLFEGIPDFSTEVVELRDLGDGLTLAVLHQTGHGALGGAPLEETVWMSARWRSGKCVWCAVFSTEAEALEAAGLSE